MIFQLIGYAALTLTGLAVLWRGGAEERTMFAIFLAASFATAGAVHVGGLWQHPELVALVDVACLAGFLVVTLRSDLFWPLWVSAFQLATVAAHPIVLLSHRVSPWVYATAVALWSYLIMATLIGAALTRKAPTTSPA